ncbi:MarR family winged helix-turn-helix transcriptional regulator [Nitratidesulfovibrio liaohensis]|uniref:MarR family winged helix-turn-helix transcriptional regulator n=1 Tax=Nitratidesulfovibrio liaohensis TaxID=2604158 RepID=UPI001FBA576E|nr:MarR family transcriptional regulator [Nitratidesulfovibrio liaohensis]
MEQRLTSFAYRVGQLRRLVLLLALERIAPLGPVGKGQIPFLAELFQAGDGVSQEELAEKLHFDKGSAARSLAKLEAAGLVTRTVNPHNRRQLVITLTPQAEALRAPFLAALRELTETMVRGFSGEEREQALGFLDRMIGNVLAELGRPARPGRHDKSCQTGQTCPICQAGQTRGGAQ